MTKEEARRLMLLEAESMGIPITPTTPPHHYNTPIATRNPHFPEVPEPLIWNEEEVRAPESLPPAVLEQKPRLRERVSLSKPMTKAEANLLLKQEAETLGWAFSPPVHDILISDDEEEVETTAAIHTDSHIHSVEGHELEAEQRHGKINAQSFWSQPRTADSEITQPEMSVRDGQQVEGKCGGFTTQGNEEFGTDRSCETPVVHPSSKEAARVRMLEEMSAYETKSMFSFFLSASPNSPHTFSFLFSSKFTFFS